MQIERVPHEVIENKLLVALDDKSKVVILASYGDLSFLIVALRQSQRAAPCNQKLELLKGLTKIREGAFLKKPTERMENK